MNTDRLTQKNLFVTSTATRCADFIIGSEDEEKCQKSSSTASVGLSKVQRSNAYRSKVFLAGSLERSTYSLKASTSSSSEQSRISHRSKVCIGVSFGIEIPCSQFETAWSVIPSSSAISLCVRLALARILASFSRGAIESNHYKSTYSRIFDLDFYKSTCNHEVSEERLALPTSTAPPTDYPDHSFGNLLPEALFLMEILL
jgi:hypothetical protein